MEVYLFKEVGLFLCKLYKDSGGYKLCHLKHMGSRQEGEGRRAWHYEPGLDMPMFFFPIE